MDDGLDFWIAVGESSGWEASGCVDPLFGCMKIENLLRGGGSGVVQVVCQT